MKYIIIIAGLCFLFSIIILQNRNINKLTEKQINLQDTLNQFRIIQMNPNDRHVIDRINFSDALEEPEYPEINDSIFEIHWITIRFGTKVNFIKLECKKDSTFKLTNKYARVADVYNGEGVNKLKKTYIRYINKSVWQEFNSNLKNIDFFEQNKRDKPAGIYIPSYISWNYVNSSPYIYSYRSTNEYTAFLDACEILLNQFEDSERRNGWLLLK